MGKGKKKAKKEKITSCICEELSNLAEGTIIKVLYIGEKEEITFERFKDNCIHGRTMDNFPIIIDCRMLVGFIILSQGDCSVFTAMDPGAVIGLPSEPLIVNVIRFEAKSEPGTTSLIALMSAGEILQEVQINQNLGTITFILTPNPMPANELTLTNIGSATIFSCNIRTE